MIATREKKLSDKKHKIKKAIPFGLCNGFLLDNGVFFFLVLWKYKDTKMVKAVSVIATSRDDWFTHSALLYNCIRPDETIVFFLIKKMNKYILKFNFKLPYIYIKQYENRIQIQICKIYYII